MPLATSAVPLERRNKTVSLLISLPGVPKRIRVGRAVMAARLVDSVPPRYPPSAKAAGIGGTVILKVTVEKDGTVKKLEATDGPSDLIPSAMEAVKQWRYEVTRLNGEPVEVVTDVAVAFAMDTEEAQH